MKSLMSLSLLGCMGAFLATANAALVNPLEDQTSLTVYNGGFGVVREPVVLKLKKGENSVAYSGVTAQLEADSVVLRDTAGKVHLNILEQSYRADVMSRELLLSFYEGKKLEFQVREPNGKDIIVSGKVIRSGYNPAGKQVSPIVEINGKLQFTIPGEPLFPALAEEGILSPTLSWKLQAPSDATVQAELGYLSSGFKWHSAYNLVCPEKGDNVDMVGWITVQNLSGKNFTNTKVKLMAGDVQRVHPEMEHPRMMKNMVMSAMADAAPMVTEKSFDNFHLYSLPRAITLRDQETKQVEFMRATGVTAPVLYIYDGAGGFRFSGMQMQDPSFVMAGNKKVGVYREFKNSENNRLGLPLPKGRVRFYRRDNADGRLEFTGEADIDHTPKNEVIRVKTGDAFDVVGERIKKNFIIRNQQTADEEFEIKLRNRKDEPITIRVVEHLYRGSNWVVISKSDNFAKKNAQTIDFDVTVPPDSEKIVTYTVRYTWR